MGRARGRHAGRNLARAGAVMAAEDSPAGRDLTWDAIPWDLTVRAPPGRRLSAIRIRFIGRKSVIGLAFDRFSPSAGEPTPTSTPTNTPSSPAARPATATRRAPAPWRPSTRRSRRW